MTILFKIFVLLFLQGARTGNPGTESGINWETVLLAGNSTLTIQADPMLMDQVLSVCNAHDINCEIKRETITGADGAGFEKATVDFKNLQFVVKSRMIEQLKNLQSRVSLQWNDQYLADKN